MEIIEHSKFGAFSIQCNKCSRGWSVSEEDFGKPIITCQDPECKSEFTIYEGIKNGLKKIEDHITPNCFLANDMFNEIIDIEIGYQMYFKLPENIKKIFKINLIPMGSFIAGAVDVSTDGFNILTSLTQNGDKSLIGESTKIMVMINTKIDDYDIPWMHVLQNALDQLRSEEYLTSILLSEIAFETYVDTAISLGYIKYGLDQDSISRLLVATELPVKVNPLMWNLYKIKLSSSTSWNNWEKKVLKWRNGFAHGSKVSATKEEAKLAYETVVDSIFHFIEGIDIYKKQSMENHEK